MWVCGRDHEYLSALCGASADADFIERRDDFRCSRIVQILFGTDFWLGLGRAVGRAAAAHYSGASADAFEIAAAPALGLAAQWRAPRAEIDGALDVWRLGCAS